MTNVSNNPTNKSKPPKKIDVIIKGEQIIPPIKICNKFLFLLFFVLRNKIKNKSDIFFIFR